MDQLSLSKTQKGMANKTLETLKVVDNQRTLLRIKLSATISILVPMLDTITPLILLTMVTDHLTMKNHLRRQKQLI